MSFLTPNPHFQGDLIMIMEHMEKLIGILMLVIVWNILGATIFAQEQPPEADKTLSPYFWVKSDDASVDPLPLRSTTAQVSIAGVIADVKVTQVYKNEGQQTLEAIYVFPASTKASVYGMKMTIGERIVIAKVREREQARQEYEQAKQEGKSASLLEQQRPNVFQMNVANILPGDVIKVELSYTELLVPTDGVYEFAYPTVVGPRYSNLPEATAPSSEQWVKNPYLREGEAPPYTFDISVNLSGSLPIQDVTCSSHKTDIGFDSPSFATVRLDPSEKSGGNRDYILRYRLAGGKIETGLLLYEGKEENFFLLMVQPPERVTQAQIPPREYVFIVDVSGSMRGFPLDISKTLLKNLIQNLRPSDKFNVMLFAGTSAILSEQSLPATAGNVSRAIQVIDNQRGGGGTELLPALKRALALPGSETCSRSVVIVTDGYVRVEKEAFDLIRNNLNHANMFAFGIGASVNRFLIEGMARVGAGEPFVITKPEHAGGKAEKFRQYIQMPVLAKIRADFGEFDAYDVEPPTLPDVLAERPVILFGKWRKQPRGKIRLTGLTGNQDYVQTIDVGKFKPLDGNSALPYLWARHRIALLSDYGKLGRGDNEIKNEVTALGLKYNLLTAYTSFVAIDSLVRNKDGKSTTVNQPLPLPQGVSDSALAGGRGIMAKSSRAKGFWCRLTAAQKTALAPPPPAPAPSVLKEESPKKDIATADAEAEKSVPKGNVIILHDEIKITGSLSRQDALEMIQKHLRAIDRCYQQTLQNTPELKGKAALKIVTDAAGQVTDVRFESENLKNEALKACITNLVKNWKFSASKDGKAVAVEYWLDFKI